MVYVHCTRDEAFLERFAPHLRPLYGPLPSDVPPALAEELRERLFALLASDEPLPETPLPRELMQKMMSIGVGERVDDEFIPLLLDQMPFEKPLPRSAWPGRKAPPKDFHVVVIGARAPLLGLAESAAAR